MHAHRWTSSRLRTNRNWPAAWRSASRRRSSLKAGVLPLSTVSRTIDLASMPPVAITLEDPLNGR
jgi:hypothetical protein